MTEDPTIFNVILLVCLVFGIRPIKYLRWIFWKKRAKAAISNGQVAQCRICKDNIFPGQKVVRTHDREKDAEEECLAHVSAPNGYFFFGGHFSMRSRFVVCAIPAKKQQGLGTWDGNRFVPAD